MQNGLSRCEPRLLDFITWSVLNGVRLFQRVQVTSSGLFATERIPEYDFAAVVPARASFSVVNVLEGQQAAIRLSPEQVSVAVPWWPDLSWGSFATVLHMSRAILSGNPRHLQVYLDILPFDANIPIGKVADASQRSKEYTELVKPMIGSSGATSEEEFHAAVRHSYCLFRRHAVPFWSGASAAGGIGHPYFSSLPMIQRNPQCEVLGLLPVIDLASHSATPNASIGFPDAEMLAWLAQEKGVNVQAGSGYFVLQAQRDILPGEQVTVDKNAFFNFDHDTFHAWFGYPHSTSNASVSKAPR